MDKFVKAFNNKLHDFAVSLDALSVFFPELLSLVTLFRNTIYLSRIVNESVPVMFFYKHIATPFGRAISARDEPFFLSHAFDDLCAQPHMSREIVVIIKRTWVRLTKENKEAIFKHLDLLLALSKACMPSSTAAPS